MLKKFIIVAIIVLVGVALFIFKNKEVVVDTTPVNSDKLEGRYSIREIMDLGKSYECRIQKNDPNASVEGIILISGNNARGFFTLKADNLESSFDSHFIITGDVSYIWTSLSSLGFKLPAVKSTSKGASPAEQASIIGIEDKEDYKCATAEPSEDSFKLPAGVSFQEVK